MEKFNLTELNDTEIINLFFNKPVVSCEIKNTSHGEIDFREAMIVQLVSGEKFVIKLADNSFTFPDRIRMWQKCAADYRRLGYYAPKIYADKTGEFPVVRYKEHTCVVYAEEFAKFSYENVAARGLASSKYLNEILTMTAKIAQLHADYAEYLSGYCLFGLFAPDDEEDEVMGVAREWKQYAETLPVQFQSQVKRIWTLWTENRNALQAIYDALPTSIFQADLNSSNTLIDHEGKFAGVFDFNLCGKDVLLNYLFREINWDDNETELELLKSAVAVVSRSYHFSPAEKAAAIQIYRCVKPLWYTKLMRLKKAGENLTSVQACLDETEYALTREIDFFPKMTERENTDR